MNNKNYEGLIKYLKKLPEKYKNNKEISKYYNIIKLYENRNEDDYEAVRALTKYQIEIKNYSTAIKQWLSIEDDDLKNEEINKIITMATNNLKLNNIELLKIAKKESTKIRNFISNNEIVINWNNEIKKKFNQMNGTIKRYLRDAKTNEIKKKYKESIILYKKIIQLDPNNKIFKNEIQNLIKKQKIQIGINNALKLIGIKKYKEALVILNQILKLEPSNDKIKNYILRVKIQIEPL